MTAEESQVIALLHVASTRLLNAATATNELRASILQHDLERARLANDEIAEHMTVIEAVFQQVIQIANAHKAAVMALAVQMREMIQ